MSSPETAEKNEVFSHFSVSRETRDKLDRYAMLLKEWNQCINLVAANSLEHVWTRHILDSAQLFKLIPASARSLADLGSGAGFPGMVLAIMGSPNVYLIESMGKKADFLRLVANELGLNVTIHQGRIEEIRNFKAEVITARALKPLPELLALAKPLMHNNSVCLFLKGQKADEELTEARKYWTFACEKIPSLSNPFRLRLSGFGGPGAKPSEAPEERRGAGTVLKISGLNAIHPHGPRHHKRSRKR